MAEFMRHSAHDRAVAKLTQQAYGSMSMAAPTEIRHITAAQPQTATASEAHATNAAMPAGCNQKITGQAALRPSCTHQMAWVSVYALEGQMGFFLHTCHIASVASTKLIHIKRSTVFPCRST